MASRLDQARIRAHEGLHHRLRHAFGGRLAKHCRPTWISLLLTERCNARCLHCDIWKNRGPEADALSPERWAALLHELRDWLGPVHVCLTGGEALLRPHTLPLVELGAELGLGIELLTHGFWGDQSRIERAARSGLQQITISLDGIGDAHDQVRGRAGFFERVSGTLETLDRIRRDEGRNFRLLFKTVVMSHNLDQLEDLVRFSAARGAQVLFQPIEQTYNTEEDARWWEHTENWPRNPEAAVAAVDRLIELHESGFPIANSRRQLEVMRPYFRDPDAWRVATQSHTAHDRRARCSALSLVQVQANGAVRVCTGAEPIGNLHDASLRALWEGRPHWWESGCCLERRLSEAEQNARGSG